MLTCAVINLHFRHQLAVSFTFSGLVQSISQSLPCLPAFIPTLNLKAPHSLFTTQLSIASWKPPRSLQSSLRKGSSKVPGWTCRQLSRCQRLMAVPTQCAQRLFLSRECKRVGSSWSSAIVLRRYPAGIGPRHKKLKSE